MEKQSEQRSEQEEIKEIITSREDGFGYRLKIARNEKNLSTADVASELRLDEKIIVALESEDHARLPVSAFVCGYIRNYAKLLHVQPEPLIECYKKEISENEFDSSPKVTKRKKLRKGFDFSRLIAPIFLLLILVLGFFGGWKLWIYLSTYNVTENSELIPETSEDANSQSLVPDLIREQDPEQKNDDPDSLSLPALNETSYVPPSEEDISEQAPALVQNRVISSSGERAGDSSDEKATDDISNETSPASEISDVEINSSGAEDTSQVEMLTSTVTDKDNRLFLEFTGNSWIIIKDANNKKLSTGLKKAGQSLQLEGKRPYKVFLGDGKVVKVSIHGKIYDHSQYINEKNIARFNVE